MSYQDYERGYDGYDCAHSSYANEKHYSTGVTHFKNGDPKLTEPEFKMSVNHEKASSGAQREKLSVLPYNLVPFQEITDAYVRVAEHGAKKYAPWNWTLGLARVQLCCSLLRHTFAYLRGQECDADSGLRHTDHILWNAAALSHNVHHDLEDGRRPEPSRDYKNEK